MKYKTKQSAIENVRKFFSSAPNDDSVSIKGAFMAWGRNLEKDKENKAWLSNKLPHLKYHDLIKPVYSFKTGYRTLDGLQLTLEGKRALGRIEDNPNGDGTVLPTTNGRSKISMEDILKAVPRLRKENPDFDIEFSVKPKENSGVAP